MEGKGQTRLSHILILGFGAILLVLLTIITTVFVTKSTMPAMICGEKSDHDLHFPKSTKWEQPGEKAEIPGTDLMIERTSDSCLIYSKAIKQDPKNARKLRVLKPALSPDQIEHFTGAIGEELCEDLPVFLLQEIVPDELDFRRLKRDANATSAPPPPVAPAAGPAPIAPAPAGEGAEFPKLPYEQRVPRCEEIILQCPDMVGKKQDCYTGVNGIFFMTQECSSPDGKQFKITMTKPPGRILKIMQQQFYICEQRRKDGLKC